MRYYHDTSAICRYYHVEPGALAVQRIVDAPTSAHYLSWLTALEVRSAFALKVRTGVLDESGFAQLIKRFKADVRNGKFASVPMRRRQFIVAEGIIARFGMTRRIRSLDALHVAIAQELFETHQVNQLVTADDTMEFVAAEIGLPVMNPLRTA